MPVRWCPKCGGSRYGPGSGRVPNPNRRWWQFWKTIMCPACGGTGYMKPPGPPPKAPSPPPPRDYDRAPRYRYGPPRERPTPKPRPKPQACDSGTPIPDELQAPLDFILKRMPMWPHPDIRVAVAPDGRITFRSLTDLDAYVELQTRRASLPPNVAASKGSVPDMPEPPPPPPRNPLAEVGATADEVAKTCKRLAEAGKVGSEAGERLREAMEPPPPPAPPPRRRTCDGSGKPPPKP